MVTAINPEAETKSAVAETAEAPVESAAVDVSAIPETPAELLEQWEGHPQAVRPGDHPRQLCRSLERRGRPRYDRPGAPGARDCRDPRLPRRFHQAGLISHHP